MWQNIAETQSDELTYMIISIVDQNPETAESFYEKLFNFQNEKGKNILECAERNVYNPKTYKVLIRKQKNPLKNFDIDYIKHPWFY